MAGSGFCQSIPTNEQILTGAVERAASRLLDSLKLTPGLFIISNQPGIDEIAGEGAGTAFIKHDWKSVPSPDFVDSTITRINIRFSSYQFKYIKGKSRGFWKRPFIKRILTGQVAINITGVRNYVGFRDIDYNDQIQYDQANFVASPKYNQLAPELPRLGISRFVEPIAVAATVGGLIYLFFASR
jgi:hypothetical protein